MLAAVDRAPAGRGSCAIRCAQDCSGDSWRQFGHDHLCHASRIRADAWSGIAAGLSSFRGLEQKEYDSSDGDASLPMVHRVISNFKAYVEGAFHGLSKKHLQSYADSYSWRYSHRSSQPRPRSSRSFLRACLSRLQFREPNYAGGTQPLTSITVNILRCPFLSDWPACSAAAFEMMTFHWLIISCPVVTSLDLAVAMPPRYLSARSPFL